MAMTNVVMPKLSEAMETGKVIKWLKQEGDRVQGGDILAEIETDKADVEMEAFGSGILRKIIVPAGEHAPVGTLIGVIAEADEDISGVLAPARATSAAGPGAGAPLPSTTPRVAAAAPPAAVTAVPAGHRVKASPLAKKIAAQSGVDLRLIQGSGPGGRIIRRDVEVAAVARPAVVAPASVTTAGSDSEDVALSPMRAIIAKRMLLSKAPVPHFYVTSEVAMDRAWDLREELNALEGQPKISVNDLVIRACALALGQHPEIGRAHV